MVDPFEGVTGAGDVFVESAIDSKRNEYADIAQGTIEWHAIRYAKVGGSTCKDLLIKDLEDSAIFHRICGEMCEDFNPDDINTFVTKDMERGNDLEPKARERLEKKIGVKFEVAAWIQSNIKILGISPDGVNKENTIAGEFKCPAKNTYNKYMNNNRLLVDDYAPQIANYFAVIPTLEKLYMCAYRPEHKFCDFIMVEVTKDFVFNNGTVKTPKLYTIGELSEDIRSRAVELEGLCYEQIREYRKGKSLIPEALKHF